MRRLAAVPARLVDFWRERKPSRTESCSGAGLLCWAVLTLLGTSGLDGTPSGQVMVRFFPEQVWAVLAGVTGALQMLAAWCPHRLPQWLAAMAAGTLWLLLAHAMASAWPGTPAAAPYLALALGCLIGALQPPTLGQRHVD